MKKDTAGVLTILMAVMFVCSETTYFGNNFFPQSPEECICDGIVFILLAIGLSLTAKE